MSAHRVQIDVTSSLKRFLPLVLFTFGAFGLLHASQTDSQAVRTVRWNGGLYVELNSLERFGFQFSAVEVGAREVDVSAEGKKWQFRNGGDRISTSGSKPVMLTHPLLVLDSRLYLHEKEAREHFQVRLDAEQISFHGKTVAHRPQTLASDFHQHKVDRLERRNEVIELKKSVQGLRSLHQGESAETIEAGQVLLVRRSCRVDGVDYGLVTRTGPNPESFLVREAELAEVQQKASLEGTDWQRRMAWFQKRARVDGALRRADSDLPEQIAVTVDLCWSMRAYEKALFDEIAREAGEGKSLAFTLFASGRWMEQHPSEMESLIQLGRMKGVTVLWGLHSWSHPKTGDFMNDFSLDEVINDTLKLEAEQLSWGIVPTVYYRFPGLIHNPKRIETVLSLGLLPIDCDAWVAEYSPRGRHPFGGPTRGGSIVLVHGNGNEPKGIELLLEWMKANRDWKWEPLSRFLPGEH